MREKKRKHTKAEATTLSTADTGSINTYYLTSLFTWVQLHFPFSNPHHPFDVFQRAVEHSQSSQA